MLLRALGRRNVCAVAYYSGFLRLWKRIANQGRPLVVYYHEIFDPRDDVRWWGEPSLLAPFFLFREHLFFLYAHEPTTNLIFCGVLGMLSGLKKIETV